MELKSLKIKGLSADELKLIEASRAGKKIAIEPEKKASFNELLIQALHCIAKKSDDQAVFSALKAFIDGLSHPADKWNYCAFLWQALKAFDSNEFEALKSLAISAKSAGEAFPTIKLLFPKSAKNISAESR